VDCGGKLSEFDQNIILQPRCEWRVRENHDMLKS
jgi:hypothetical protein